MGAEATTKDKPQFTKKKISLTRRHADKLESLANEHHGGIQSQCIRRALDNYEQVVRGHESFATTEEYYLPDQNYDEAIRDATSEP